MKKISKQTAFKIAIIVLSVMLVAVSAFAVYIGAKVRRSEFEIENFSIEASIGEDYSWQLDEEISEKESLKEAKEHAEQQYKERMKENQSKINELSNEISRLNQQIAAQNGVLPSAKPQVTYPEIIPSKDKTVYLTFDDGPSPNTPAILDILDRYGVKATFFVINGGYNRYMKDIVDRGHQIALHSYTHTYSLIYASDAAYFEDLQRISDVVASETGVRTNIIRFPGGSSNTVSKKYSPGIMSRLTKAVTEKGYVYFDWNCANGDATGEKSTVETQLRYCSQFPRSSQDIIVLMHDVGNKKSTVESLPKIIEYYQSCGMKFGVLTENTPPAHHSVNN